MKVGSIETPIEYILKLNWDRENLEKAKNHLEQWDKLDYSFITPSYSKMAEKVDRAEREHFRNCIKYYEGKLNED